MQVAARSATAADGDDGPLVAVAMDEHGNHVTVLGAEPMTSASR